MFRAGIRCGTIVPRRHPVIGAARSPLVAAVLRAGYEGVCGGRFATNGDGYAVPEAMAALMEGVGGAAAGDAVAVVALDSGSEGGGIGGSAPGGMVIEASAAAATSSGGGDGSDTPVGVVLPAFGADGRDAAAAAAASLSEARPVACGATEDGRRGNVDGRRWLAWAVAIAMPNELY